jgi:adenine deaminase
MNTFTIRGNIPDFSSEKFFHAEITVEDGIITSVTQLDRNVGLTGPFILPGFIDSHVHIESSMLVPSEFARLAVVHGTVATVSDPHEIANVCGTDGVQFMIGNAKNVNFKFYFGAPSCVPATNFETAGDTIDSSEITTLLERDDIKYLSEMMNFPGVINGDEEVLRKISAAHSVLKPVDGHAPGLRGNALAKYVSAGISTDHECFTREEAEEKLKLGMKIIIREGSAARNFDALIDLLNYHPDDMMFCSDDKHPDSLVEGHINQLCVRAIENGISVFNVLKAASINPVRHYNLSVGTLKVNDPADFIIVENIERMVVKKTYINGLCVAENGKTKIERQPVNIINRFNCEKILASALSCNAKHFLINKKLPVIEALDGQLITNKLSIEPNIHDNIVLPDIENDILKLVVINRYTNAPPAVSFIKGFGLKDGAIASSVAHDSHNIIAVGIDDISIAEAINLIVENQGGISCISPSSNSILPLPVAGLMSTDDGYNVARAYTAIDKMAKSLGISLKAPFMTLSFMGLLVIPSLKLSDKGLFDGDNFDFVYKS